MEVAIPILLVLVVLLAWWAALLTEDRNDLREHAKTLSKELADEKDKSAGYLAAVTTLDGKAKAAEATIQDWILHVRNTQALVEACGKLTAVSKALKGETLPAAGKPA